MEKLDTDNALFTNYIFKSIPLAFDESMSYYEVLAGVLAYLKDTIVPSFNELAEEVEGYSERITNVETQVTNVTTKLLEIEQELTNYLKATDVDAYFLQERIEGSDDVVVDVNEDDKKLQVRLDKTFTDKVDAKQDKLTAGQNITIDENNVISATGEGGTTDYNALTNKPQVNSVELSGNKSLTELGIQKTLTAGTNITITDEGVISASGEGGTTNYNDLVNKPKINDVELTGNKTLSDLSLYDKDEIDLKESMLQETITESNEGTSTIATSDRSQGDLVFINGILYQCTTDIKTGETYSLDTNIKKMEVEDYVKAKQSQMKSYVDAQDDKKQDLLVSGTNIKTINEQSILGEGNITIEGGGNVDDVQVNGTSVVTDKVANIDLSDYTKLDEVKTLLYNLTRRTRNNITSNLTNLSQAIAEQNLEKYGYTIGDYFTGASGYTYHLADMDTRYGGYDNYPIVSTHHCGIVVDTHASSTWLSSGSASSYSASTLHSYLTNTALPNIKTDLETLFGDWSSHLIARTELDNSVGGFGTIWTGLDSCYICAMSEVEVYGARVFGCDGNQTGTCSKPLELFAKYKWNEIFGNSTIWLKSLYSSSSACNANHEGYAGNSTLTQLLGVVGLILFK